MFNLQIERPIALVKVYKNKDLVATVSNTVTQKGLDAIMESTLTPIVDPVGGRLKNLTLGHSPLPITFESETPTDIIDAGPLTTTATVSYVTENNKRYAYATLFYSFTNPVTSTEPLRQIMITQSNNTGPILFGLTLENEIDLSMPVEIDIAYTIRFPILSAVTELTTGNLYGFDYTLYGKFNTEISNVVRYEWPANTSGATDSSTALSRYYVNNSLLGANSGRYTSNRVRDEYLYTQDIDVRILSLIPGNINIITLEFGAVVTGTNGYTLRLAFNGSVTKQSTELMDIDLTFTVNWGDVPVPFPTVYGSLFPHLLLTD